MTGKITAPTENPTSSSEETVPSQESNIPVTVTATKTIASPSPPSSGRRSSSSFIDSRGRNILNPPPPPPPTATTTTVPVTASNSSNPFGIPVQSTTKLPKQPGPHREPTKFYDLSDEDSSSSDGGQRSKLVVIHYPVAQKSSSSQASSSKGGPKIQKRKRNNEEDDDDTKQKGPAKRRHTKKDDDSSEKKERTTAITNVKGEERHWMDLLKHEILEPFQHYIEKEKKELAMLYQTIERVEKMYSELLKGYKSIVDMEQQFEIKKEHPSQEDQQHLEQEHVLAQRYERSLSYLDQRVQHIMDSSSTAIYID